MFTGDLLQDYDSNLPLQRAAAPEQIRLSFAPGLFESQLYEADHGCLCNGRGPYLAWFVMSVLESAHAHSGILCSLQQSHYTPKGTGLHLHVATSPSHPHTALLPHRRCHSTSWQINLVSSETARKLRCEWVAQGQGLISIISAQA